MSPRKREIDWQYIFDRVQPEPNSGCWLWLGELNNAGYGRTVQGYAQNKSRVRRLAHRVTYQMVHGEIPPGLDLDHKCRVRCCCNPDHLEPVTRSENNRRGDLMRRKGVRLCTSNEPWAIGLNESIKRKKLSKIGNKINGLS